MRWSQSAASLAIFTCLGWIPIALLGPSALAQEASVAPSGVGALYAAGDYDLCAEQGGASASAEDLTVASRCLMAKALLQDDPKTAKRLARKARGLAGRAIGAAEHAEAHFQSAAALGVIGLHTSGLVAHMRGYAGEGRRHIEDGMELDPNNPWGPALMGAWHYEVVRRGGARVYGASLKDGDQWFKSALEMDEGNVAIAYNYAMALAQVEDDASRRAEAVAQFENVVSGIADTAFSAALQSRAAVALAGMTNERR